MINQEVALTDVGSEMQRMTYTSLAFQTGIDTGKKENSIGHSSDCSAV